MVLPILLAAYFIPTYIALPRKHPQRTLILLLNVLASWSIVGLGRCAPLVPSRAQREPGQGLSRDAAVPRW